MKPIKFFLASFAVIISLILSFNSFAGIHDYTEQEILNMVLKDATLSSYFHDYSAQEVLNLVYDSGNYSLRVYLDSLGTLEVDTLYPFTIGKNCYVVGEDNHFKYNTVEEALDVATPKDVILVLPGTYTGHITASVDSVTIVSLCGAERTFLSLTMSSNIGLAITGRNVTIDGFTLTGSAAGALIGINGAPENVTIKNCVINTTGSPTFGIDISTDGSDSTKLINNLFISNVGDGCFWGNKSITNMDIIGNEFLGADSTSGYAIQFAGMVGCVIRDNFIHGGFASGIFPHTVSGTASSNIRIEGNYVSECSKAIRLGHSSNSENLSDIWVLNNVLHNNTDGIYIASGAKTLPAGYMINGNTMFDNFRDYTNANTTAANLRMNDYGTYSQVDDITVTGDADIDSLYIRSFIASYSGNLKLLGVGTGYVEIIDTLKIPSGAGASKVFTSDANGIGTWQTAPSGTVPSSGTTDGVFLIGDGATSWETSTIKSPDGTIIDVPNKTSLQSGITTDYSRIYTYDDGSTVHLMATKDDAGTETQVKLAEQSSITNLSAKGAGYYFDGVNDYVSRTYILGAEPVFTHMFTIMPNRLKTYSFIFADNAGTDNRFGAYVDTDGAVQVSSYDGATTLGFKGSENLAINNMYNIAISKESGIGTQPKIYINGISNSVTTGTYTSPGGVAGFRFGSNTATYFGAINYFMHRIFNLVLTQTEIKNIFESGVPYKYKGASQTELMPNQVDRDFSGANAWADVDLVAGSGAFNSTTDLTITAGAAGAGDYCTCPVASMPTAIGYNYSLKFDVANLVGTWTIKSFDGTQTIGTVSAEGLQQELTWVATTTGGLRIVAVSDLASADFDNFTLKHTGCVAEYLPEGIGHYSWMDNSGNGLHGTNSGATPFGLNIGDTRTAYLLTTSTSPTMIDVQKGGWKVKSIAMETAQNLTEIDCTQETSAIELLSDKTLNNGKMVWSTLADHMLYAAGTDKDLVFKLTGNGGAGTKIYVELQKVY